MKLPTRTLLTLALAAGAALAQAGTVSVSAAQVAPYSPGDRVTFTVSDSRARDMFVADPGGGFSAADFNLLYDPLALMFESIEYAPWIIQSAGAFLFDNSTVPPNGNVEVTMAGFDELELPDAPESIFSVSFIVGTATQGFVTVAPPDQPSYVFTPETLRFGINAIPLPTSLLLAAAGLAALGLSRRRAV